eukprot:456489-Pelagomonas_calceolata.AAC.2
MNAKHCMPRSFLSARTCRKTNTADLPSSITAKYCRSLQSCNIPSSASSRFWTAALLPAPTLYRATTLLHLPCRLTLHYLLQACTIAT